MPNASHWALRTASGCWGTSANPSCDKHWEVIQQRDEGGGASGRPRTAISQPRTCSCLLDLRIFPIRKSPRGDGTQSAVVTSSTRIARGPHLDLLHEQRFVIVEHHTDLSRRQVFHRPPSSSAKSSHRAIAGRLPRYLSVAETGWPSSLDHGSPNTSSSWPPPQDWRRRAAESLVDRW